MQIRNIRAESWKTSRSKHGMIGSFLLCLAIVCFSNLKPGIIPESITSYAEGGAIALIGVIVYRFVDPVGRREKKEERDEAEVL